MYNDQFQRFIRIDNKAYPLEEVLKALGIKDSENHRIELCQQVPVGELRAGVCRHNTSPTMWIDTCLVMGDEQEDFDKMDRIGLTDIHQCLYPKDQTAVEVDFLTEDDDQDMAARVVVDTRPSQERWDSPHPLALSILHPDVEVKEYQTPDAIEII